MKNYHPLLGREILPTPWEELEKFYKEKRVLITGAGGSIGRELIKHLFHLPIKEIYALEIDETELFLLYEEYKNKPLHPILADIRDQQRIKEILEEISPIDILFHAAAYKHVFMMEKFPQEGVKNNILGSFTLFSLAGDFSIPYIVHISTDKAVLPRGVMGASKRVAELIGISLQEKYPNSLFLSIRFGNILGSRGSVLKLFEKQIQERFLLLTHPEAKRYFFLPEEAIYLLLKTLSIDPTPREIFVLYQEKPVSIQDLALRFIKEKGFSPKEIPIYYSGLKEGEKKEEDLFYPYEDPQKTSCPYILRVKNPPLPYPWILEVIEETKSLLSSPLALAKYLQEKTHKNPFFSLSKNS